MNYSIDGMIYWIIPQETMNWERLFVTILIGIFMMSVEIKIILNTNIEEKRYVNHLMEIFNKENSHV